MPLEKLSESIRGKKDQVAGGASVGQEPEVTDAMPVVPHRVIYAGLPFFTDKECTQQVQDARIYVLQPLEADAFDAVDVVPARYAYQAGQYLTWRLNKDSLWEDCFYRNPDTGLVERAWTLHVEFVGQVISDKAVAADRQRLDKLEEAYRAKHSNETVM